MIKKIFVAILCIFLISSIFVNAEELQSIFNKYEIINTPERIVAGVDASQMLVYVRDEMGIGVYDITEDKKLFDVDSSKKLGPWKDNSAVLIDKDGNVEGIISKKGKLIAEFSGSYAYAGEFENGLICLIDKTLTENVYSLTDRKGNFIVQGFFAPECELFDGSIIISNMGGGFSKISKKGKITPFNCAKNVLIEDAVSKQNGVYVSTDGNIYDAQNKLLYKNNLQFQLAPINEEYALCTNMEKKYILELKSGTLVEINDNGIFESYVYSGGEVSGECAFVGNSEKSVLVNLKSGELVSPQLLSYSPFYNGASSVKFTDGSFGFIDNNGRVISEKFDYVSNFKYGYAVAIKKSESEAKVFVITKNGNQREIYSTKAYYSINFDTSKTVFSVKGENGIINDVAVQKTTDGNLYVGSNLNGGYLFQLRSEGASTKIVTGVLILLAGAYIVALGLKNYSRRKKANK